MQRDKQLADLLRLILATVPWVVRVIMGTIQIMMGSEFESLHGTLPAVYLLLGMQLDVPKSHKV